MQFLLNRRRSCGDSENVVCDAMKGFDGADPNGGDRPHGRHMMPSVDAKARPSSPRWLG
jgi:hypothetical protein